MSTCKGLEARRMVVKCQSGGKFEKVSHKPVKMELPHIAEQLNLSSAIVAKAEELIRLAQVQHMIYLFKVLLNGRGAYTRQLRATSSKANSSISRPAVCAFLAAAECGEPLDKVKEEACIRVSGTTKKLFRESVLVIGKLLNLESGVSHSRSHD